MRKKCEKVEENSVDRRGKSGRERESECSSRTNSDPHLAISFKKLILK